MQYIIVVTTPYFVYTQLCNNYTTAMLSLNDLLQQKSRLKSKFTISVKHYTPVISLSSRLVA